MDDAINPTEADSRPGRAGIHSSRYFRYLPIYPEHHQLPETHGIPADESDTSYIKRRTVFLSYMEDLKDSRSLVRTGSSTSEA